MKSNGSSIFFFAEIPEKMRSRRVSELKFICRLPQQTIISWEWRNSCITYRLVQYALEQGTSYNASTLCSKLEKSNKDLLSKTIYSARDGVPNFDRASSERLVNSAKEIGTSYCALLICIVCWLPFRCPKHINGLYHFTREGASSAPACETRS
jgi:hypothetical protein